MRLRAIQRQGSLLSLFTELCDIHFKTNTPKQPNSAQRYMYSSLQYSFFFFLGCFSRYNILKIHLIFIRYLKQTIKHRPWQYNFILNVIQNKLEVSWTRFLSYHTPNKLTVYPVLQKSAISNYFGQFCRRIDSK